MLMPDYRGEWDGCEEYTIYPEGISYANYRLAGRHLDFADESAKETSWYEWVAVARYCLKYLQAMQGIGYKELAAYRAGAVTLEEIAPQPAKGFPVRYPYAPVAGALTAVCINSGIRPS